MSHGIFSVSISKSRLFSLSKIVIPVILFIAILVTNGLGQVTSDNPDKPKNKNAGRTVLLEEVMRIEDDGKNVIFKIPRDLSLLEDGSIYILDFIPPSCLYKFSRDGQFLFKALRQGQGPRECQYASNFFFMGNRIRVQAWLPPKVMDYDLDGRYISEIKTGDTHGLWFIKFIDGKIYGIRDEIPHSDAIFKEGLIESPYTLYEISEDFKKWTKIYEFPVRHYIKRAHWFRRDMVAAAAYDHYLFMVHSAEYRIVKFDLRRGQIERTFKRKFKREDDHQKSRPEKEEFEDPEARGLKLPPFEFNFDIFEIHVFKDTLWVVTFTTKDNGAKRLVDVFDMEGKYIDSFYLQFPWNGQKHFYAHSLVSDNGFMLMQT